MTMTVGDDGWGGFAFLEEVSRTGCRSGDQLSIVGTKVAHLTPMRCSQRMKWVSPCAEKFPKP
ncbi:hypothetical protein [Telmatospirillum siberiense]|uniref:hypothetical protein n=1 Tax=Telmatospirillum siberiense TaxID=382514 RepID=UPI0011AF4C84|nr:hypothetical protein [Telmatospirillum siberiense]